MWKWTGIVLVRGIGAAECISIFIEDPSVVQIEYLSFALVK
ncbi:MAG: hypothetical protein ACI33P_10105 [Lysinibacillus sp.]